MFISRFFSFFRSNPSKLALKIARRPLAISQGEKSNCVGDEFVFRSNKATIDDVVALAVRGGMKVVPKKSRNSPESVWK